MRKHRETTELQVSDYMSLPLVKLVEMRDFRIDFFLEIAKLSAMTEYEFHENLSPEGYVHLSYGQRSKVRDLIWEITHPKDDD